MGVKSDMVNGAVPYQVRTKRPAKDETDLRGDAVGRMPHERDESDDSQEGGVRDDMKQAYDDVMSGQVDTDLREGRGVERTVEHDKETQEATAGAQVRTPGAPMKHAQKGHGGGERR